MITVFTTNACPQCLVTKRHLEKLGLEYEEIRIDRQVEWVDLLKEQGFSSAPVVLVDEDDVWSGYRSEDIDYAARHYAQ